MSKRPSKTRRGLVVYDENPFVNIDTVKTKTKRIVNKRGDMMMINGDTGEVVSPVAGFWQAQEVDSTQFIKLYINGVKALAELTPAGTKVFGLLYMEMQKSIGKDRVLLSYAELEGTDGTVGLSQATFTRGVRELIDKGFIAPSRVVGFYWLNPDYVFNGDRLAFVKEYRKASEKKSKEPIPGQLEMSILPLLNDTNEVRE